MEKEELEKLMELLTKFLVMKGEIIRLDVWILIEKIERELSNL